MKKTSETLTRSFGSFFTFVAIIQVLTFALHYIAYISIVGFFEISDVSIIRTLQISFTLLSLLFLVTSIAIHKVHNRFANFMYLLGCIWMGTLHFLILGCALTSIATLFHTALQWNISLSTLTTYIFSFVFLLNIYAIWNGITPRVRNKTFTLPHKIPETWKNRKIVFISDTHFGNVFGIGRVNYIARKVAAQKPDVILIGGDFFDGPIGPYEVWAKTFTEIAPAPGGTYYVTGNHEEYEDGAYISALASVGVQILNTKSVVLDGIRIAGIGYADSEHKEDFAAFLKTIPHTEPVILLKHSPKHADALENSPVSLMLSGHTHKGQVWPFTWLTYFLYKGFNAGLKKSGNTLVYTSTGAQGWGPPHRWFTQPEIVVFSIASQ